MAKKEEKETVAASLQHRSPERVIAEEPKPGPLEPSAVEVEAAKRVKVVQDRLKGTDLPDSMKAYIVMQSLSDKEIDAMEKDWKDNRVVRHGSRQWGEAKE